MKQTAFRPSLAVDEVIRVFDRGLRAVSGVAQSSAVFPESADSSLGDKQRDEVGAMMRVNHAGEVCAQSLYLAQALAARRPELRAAFLRSGEEESEHLAWTAMRLDELGARRSMLDPLWFVGSAAIALAVAGLGDRHSLAFLRETELQVAEHLEGHLRRLPEADRRSRAIIERMRAEELGHAELAEREGAPTMHAAARLAMRVAARVMTTVAARV